MKCRGCEQVFKGTTVSFGVRGWFLTKHGCGSMRHGTLRASWTGTGRCSARWQGRQAMKGS